MAEKLGPYLLNRRIGIGGMADVFLAEGPMGTCVVKRPHPHLTANAEFVRMFLDEAAILAQLHHPGIAQIFDLGHSGNAYYLAMEYVPGFDLMTISLEHERQGELIAPELCARMVADAANALHYAHEAKDKAGRPLNIIHRDVTPHNILLSTRGAVKLIDFGVARANSTMHRTQAGLVKGKYPYMSPEQITGQYIDRRVDVYALGLVLYELLTNVRAIAGQLETEQIDNARSGRIRPIAELRPNTPVPLQQIVASCLYHEPEGRYPTALAVKQDLEKYLVYERHVVGQEDLLRLFRVVAAELRSDLVPTDEAKASGFPTEQEQPISALVLSDTLAHGSEDELAQLGVAPTRPSMKAPELALPTEEMVPRATDPRPGVGQNRAKATQPPLEQTAGPGPVPTRTVPKAPDGGPLRAAHLASTEKHAAVVRKARWPWLVAGVLVAVAAAVGVMRPWDAAVSAVDAGVAAVEPGPFVFPEDAGSAHVEASPVDAGPLGSVLGALDPRNAEAAGRDDAPVEPKPDPAIGVGTLKIVTEPSMEVSVDGRRFGRAPLTLELSAGGHAVQLARPADHLLRPFSVKLQPGETRLLKFAPEKGTLRIDVVPFAQLFLNEERLGEGSFKELELFEGTYTVRFSLADPSLPQPVVRRRQVTVKAGQTVELKENMLP